MTYSNTRKQVEDAQENDEMLVCERCGISFLWSVEEQRHHQRQVEPQHETQIPQLCPGCKKVLPPENRERGVVKWYSPRKNYGFIIRPERNDIFIHRSQLQNINRLHEGDLVEFATEEGKKGPMAVSLRVIQKSSDSSS